MDIVTHGMMGMVAASPFVQTDPIAAGCFMLGSVAPDLDTFSRVFGKRAFLKVHQTYSHALPIILGLGVAMGFYGTWTGGVAFALGMTTHSLLDVTNTYGITLFAPFSNRRFCTEWVFFIDAVVLAVVIPAFVVVMVHWQNSVDTGPDAGWVAQAIAGGLLAIYWPIKVILRRRAARLSPHKGMAFLPSALIPWHFLGCARDGTDVVTFRINALSGAIMNEERIPVLDEPWIPLLETLPEYIEMRKLSPAYHVIAITETDNGQKELLCRDLRTRNFTPRFGELTVTVDASGALMSFDFHA